MDATNKNHVPSINSSSASRASTSNVLDFKRIPLMMFMKYLAGTIYVKILMGFGILNMGKMNPDSIIDGSRVAISASIIATSWFGAILDMKTPIASAQYMNSTESPKSIIRFP
jgi:hypothetical protein